MTTVTAKATTDLQVFSADQLEIIKTQIAPGISNGDLSYCLEIARQAQLNPIIKDIYFVPRKQNIGTYQNPNWVEKHEPMIGRRGARAIARRKGMIVPPNTGHTIKQFPKLDKDGKWVMEQDLIGWAEIEIAGQRVRKEAAYSIYKQTNKDGKVTQFWEKMPTTMVEKVAEFQLLDAVYGLDGIMSIDAGTVEETAPTPTSIDTSSIPTAKYSELFAAVSKAGISLRLEGNIAIAEGNTHQNAKLLKGLAFSLSQGKWRVPCEDDREQEQTTIPQKPQTQQSCLIGTLSSQLILLGLEVNEVEVKGVKYAIVEGKTVGHEDRLIEMGFALGKTGKWGMNLTEAESAF